MKIALEIAFFEKNLRNPKEVRLFTEKGYAFISFIKHQSAQEAIRHKTGTQIEGHTVRSEILVWVRNLVIFEVFGVKFSAKTSKNRFFKIAFTARPVGSFYWAI